MTGQQINMCLELTSKYILWKRQIQVNFNQVTSYFGKKANTYLTGRRLKEKEIGT